MIKGIYTSALGLIPLQKKLEVVANNLANVNTTGFKRDDAFNNELISAGSLLRDGAAEPTERDIDVKTETDFSQGALQQTNNPLDVALDGEGFFAVATSDGMRLTRDGSFMLSTDGTLVTRNGDAVLGTAGAIRIDDAEQLQTSRLVIEKDGVIKAGNKIYGQLRIVSPENLNGISKAGNNSYAVDPGGVLRDVDMSSVKVRQGYLEGSNVNPIDEMVAMIQLQSNFEAGQKAIQSQDSSLDKANQIGQV